MKNLKYIILLLFVVGCLNKSNTENPELLNSKEGRKTELDTVYISKDSLVNLYSLKSEYNEIVMQRDEFFSNVFEDPDMTYKKYLNANNDNRFISEFGTDAYFQWYAYFLNKKYNSEAYSNKRSKLVELYHSINKAYAIMARGGSGFAHNIPRIYAYVEWDIYNHYVLNNLDENSATNFLAEKELYIDSNNKILKLDKFRNNETLKLLFDSTHKKIENEFYLKHVIQFQERFHHILKL